ncbi:MAG TPA: transcriptional repressor LexA [Novosphingobium sp.]|nr:transcriptional repressor LexA [Novosphingobium sp.]
MLTRKQHELLRFIQIRLEDTGISPSFEEMKDALDLKSKSGVHRLISALEERGFIRRLPNRARALEVIRQPEDATAPRGSTQAQAAPALGPQAAGRNSSGVSANAFAGRGVINGRPSAANDVIEIPLHGRIAAGVPIEAFEGQTMLPVPAALLGAGDHYALEVSGDSMIEAGILDGDFALVKRTDTARDGEIVVALVRGEEATLKYLRRQNGMVCLDPANSAYEPQIYPPGEVVVQGKLAGLLRRYH